MDTINTTISHSLDDAISSVIQINYPGMHTQQALAHVMIRRAIDEIPEEITGNCSYRLLQGGAYISVNVMNYLLFRAPAYSDRGGKLTYDFFLILPTRVRGQELVHGVDVDARFIFQFAYFECINIGLNLDEMVFLRKQHWSLYKEACRMAATARKSRAWPSNISV